jgi:hypothetical protein
MVTALLLYSTMRSAAEARGRLSFAIAIACSAQVYQCSRGQDPLASGLCFGRL